MSGEATHEQLWEVALPTRDEHSGMSFYDKQCYSCAFYHELSGERAADWGVCFNPQSAYRGRVKFEHQGCEQHAQEQYEPIDPIEPNPGHYYDGPEIDH